MTNETKFTDGPWHKGNKDEFGDFAITGPDKGLAIAAVVNGKMRELCGDEQKTEADADLIASAPDLYEACDYALGHLLDNDKYKNDDVLWSMVSHFVVALKKARGESHE